MPQRSEERGWRGHPGQPHPQQHQQYLHPRDGGSKAAVLTQTSLSGRAGPGGKVQALWMLLGSRIENGRAGSTKTTGPRGQQSPGQNHNHPEGQGPRRKKGHSTTSCVSTTCQLSPARRMVAVDAYWLLQNCIDRCIQLAAQSLQRNVQTVLKLVVHVRSDRSHSDVAARALEVKHAWRSRRDADVHIRVHGVQRRRTAKGSAASVAVSATCIPRRASLCPLLAGTYSSGQPCSLSKQTCLLYTSPSPRDRTRSRMPSSA